MAKKIARLPAKSKTALKKIITVKNADGDPDTTAEILIQNKIKYTPKVSVIIPVYNVEKYLRECLDSVVNQTLKEIEIICVDDGSTDSSLDILKEYACKDNRITVITQKNLHAGVARNAGLAVARGEYLSFLDSDDFFELNMLEMALNACIVNNVDIAIWGGKAFENGNYKILNWVFDTKQIHNLNHFSCADKEVAERVFQIICGWPTNKLYSSKLLKKSNFRFSSAHHHNDTSFVMSNVVFATKMTYIQDLYYIYRRNSNSISANKDKQVAAFAQSLIDTYNNIKKLKVYPQIERSFINYVVDFSVHYYDSLRFKESKEEAIKLCTELYNKFVQDKEVSYFYNKEKYYKFKNSICNIDNEIPVILSSDDNYAPYMYVTMLSILKNASKSSFYDFYLLIPGDFSKKNKKNILQLKNKYNCDVHFINLNDTFKNTKMSIKHISYVTYFRLLAADLLPVKYSKCIYLDTDICVHSDLNELYTFDIEDNYVAGVPAAAYIFNKDMHIKRLKIQSVNNYINAGVLIMNLKEIRKDNLTEKFLSLMNNNYESQDQDIINVACYKRIKILPLRFNLMTKYAGLFNQKLQSYTALKEIYEESNIKEALEKPVIIHFANPEKPWQNKKLPLSDIWWSYAYATPYFHKKRNIKPYLLFPYYLIAMVFMKYIKIPVLKFVKHTKQIWYSHSHRGKMDMLNKNFTKIMQSVISVKNDMTNQITQIKNQQSNLEKQIADLRHTTGVKSNDLSQKIIDLNTVTENKSNDLSQQIAEFQSSTSQSNDALAQKIIDLNTVTENKSNDLSQQIADFQSSASQSNDALVQKIIDLINTTKDIPDTIAQHASEQIKAIQHNVETLNQQNKDTQSNIINTVDQIKKHADELTVMNSEPYWAHVYHDTTANTTWLKNKSVSPGRWAISYIVLYVLYRILDEAKPKSILECGLGQSSKLTIQYADSHNADLTICENNPEWLSFFQRQFPTADKYTTILDTEMVNIVPEHESRTYANFKPTIGNKKFNLVLIDGPLGSPHYSRPEILDIVDNLDKSFVILLDDMNRIGEQETWQLLKQKLHSKGIEFKERKYSSDKTVGLICSMDLAYLTSL